MKRALKIVVAAGAVVALDPLAEEQALKDGFARELVRVVPYGVDASLYPCRQVAPRGRDSSRGRRLCQR